MSTNSLGISSEIYYLCTMIIFVSVKPKSRVARVSKVDETHYVVSVREPPVDNKANEAVISALAEHFAISKSRIRLVSGYGGRRKIFEVLSATSGARR
jgi:hypothetical protein